VLHGDPRRPAVAAKGSAPAAFARREKLAAPHALLGRFFCRGLALGTRNSRQGRSDFQSLQEEQPTGATSCDRPFPVFAFQTHRPIGGERVLDEVRTSPPDISSIRGNHALAGWASAEDISQLSHLKFEAANTRGRLRVRRGPDCCRSRLFGATTSTGSSGAAVTPQLRTLGPTSA